MHCIWPDILLKYGHSDVVIFLVTDQCIFKFCTVKYLDQRDNPSEISVAFRKTKLIFIFLESQMFHCTHQSNDIACFFLQLKGVYWSKYWWLKIMSSLFSRINWRRKCMRSKSVTNITQTYYYIKPSISCRKDELETSEKMKKVKSNN